MVEVMYLVETVEEEQDAKRAEPGHHERFRQEGWRGGTGIETGAASTKSGGIIALQHKVMVRTRTIAAPQAIEAV